MLGCYVASKGVKVKYSEYTWSSTLISYMYMKLNLVFSFNIEIRLTTTGNQDIYYYMLVSDDGSAREVPAHSSCLQHEY